MANVDGMRLVAKGLSEMAGSTHEQEASTTQATLGGLVALSDQIEAAVTDVLDAWVGFLFVTDQSSPSRGDAVTVPSDKMLRAADVMHLQVVRLRALAEEIRSRT